MNFEIFEKLNQFRHIKFEEKQHLYTVGQKKLISVTTLIKKFESDKDWQEIAEKYAAKNGETAEYWRDQWKQEGDIAGEKGSQFHLYAENSIANKVYGFDIDKLNYINDQCDKIDWFEPSKVMSKLKMMWDLFWYQANENLVPIRSEYVVGDVELGVAGMLDQLFWNKKAQQIQIWDWKTSKKVAKSNQYQKFKGVFSAYDECEFIKYSIQISIYKHIIKKNLGLEIGDCYIGWFHENNETYKIIKTLDLSKEVELMFKAA